LSFRRPPLPPTVLFPRWHPTDHKAFEPLQQSLFLPIFGPLPGDQHLHNAIPMTHHIIGFPLPPFSLHRFLFCSLPRGSPTTVSHPSREASAQILVRFSTDLSVVLRRKPLRDPSIFFLFRSGCIFFHDPLSFVPASASLSIAPDLQIHVPSAEVDRFRPPLFLEFLNFFLSVFSPSSRPAR